MRRRTEPYRRLRVFTVAGIAIREAGRSVVAGFLDGPAFTTDEGRAEWCRRIIFAVKIRRAYSPGGVVVRLAQYAVAAPEILYHSEVDAYEVAVRLGFGTTTWDIPPQCWTQLRQSSGLDGREGRR